MELHLKENTAALAQAMRESAEYRQYREARELAFESAHIRALYEEYKRLQVQLQAAALSGRRDEAQEKRLQALFALLHDDADASAFLLAEYMLQQTVAEIYRMLAMAVELDTSHLDE